MTFKWPDSILYDGREIFCCRKMPNYAEFMLTGAYMNKKIYITRQDLIKYQ